jgi:hypothetical protein
LRILDFGKKYTKTLVYSEPARFICPFEAKILQGPRVRRAPHVLIY